MKKSSSETLRNNTAFVTYIGQYNHTVDPKNRLFLPARFRNKNMYVITRGLESCLYLYDPEGWRNVLSKLEGLALEDKVQERAFKRALLSGAHEVTLDHHGRILVPQTLKDYAGLRTDVMILGVGNRLEVWDTKLWESYFKKEASVSFKTLAGKLEI